MATVKQVFQKYEQDRQRRLYYMVAPLDLLREMWKEGTKKEREEIETAVIARGFVVKKGDSKSSQTAAGPLVSRTFC